MKYEPFLIEKKWQAFWEKEKTFRAIEDPKKAKYYVLDMFPYPSGAGLHVGHLVGYTATDIVARYKWQKGFTVLHPMGWDSFGLPAEQYAIRTGTHPKATTEANIANFKKQLSVMGYAYDWDRELATSDPTYYKWTQWIFTKLYEKGLAYQAELLVNYCPALGTVLSNEEVENGKSIEGGHPVERRPLKQWVLKITEYADRLLKDLDLVDWPDSLKRLQRNWIGKSEGASITFKTDGDEITVFTTCPETLFGVTYLVLSPENPLVSKITKESHKKEVKEYQKRALSKTDLERTELGFEKTGAFTGSYALHPLTKKPIPIWISDYVLMNVGTGAVMAVPSHDERDFAFAKKFDLPLIPVVLPGEKEAQDKVLKGEECFDGDGTIINSEFLNNLTVHEAKKEIILKLEREKMGKRMDHYRLRDWLFSRQRYWGEPFPILHFEDGSMRALTIDELPLLPPDISDFKPDPTGESPLARVKEWVEIKDPKTNKPAKRETNTMPQWAGSCWYYLRFCDPHNEAQAWDKAKERFWMSVDLYVGGAEHAVLHLLYSRFWHKVLFDLGLVSTSEPFHRLCNQGLIVSRSYKRRGGGYVEENEVEEKEGKYFYKGEEIDSQVEKMSKSKLNGVSPDEVIEEFGADALRLYAMFMGPIDKEKVWNTDGVSGCRRFLNRFYEMATSEKVSDESSDEGLRLGHLLVKGVTEDIEKMLFNTAIAKMMEFISAFNKLDHYPKEVVKMAILVLAPFAPHVAEELWCHLGGVGSVAHQNWPTFDPKYLQESQTTYVVQVNGKLRGSFELPLNKTKEEILALALENPLIKKHVTGEIEKVIFVPNKLLNIVLK